MTDAPPDGWDRLTLALRLLQVDAGLGGLVLRGRTGPARDAGLAACRAALPGLRRLHPAFGAEELDGGIDVQGTLAAGRVVRLPGLLAGAGAFLLPMAERAGPLLTSRLAARLDGGDVRLIACDEGLEEEAIPPALADRCAFAVGFDDPDLGPPQAAPAPGPAGGPVTVTAGEEVFRQIVALAVELGIAGLRAPRLALRAAKAHAALHGRGTVAQPDLEAVLPLVYAHRATRMPEPPAEEQPEARETEAQGDGDPDRTTLPEDIVLDAIRAALPRDLLDRLAATRARGGTGAGSGARRSGNRRGRPLPARPGPGNGRGRIDLMATLRAAAPLQTIRRRSDPDRRGPIIRSDDLRRKRYEETSDRLLIFTVDASGSAAFARLAEAKGAVELLLAEAYARRDQVALIAFRGRGAELLLPPTRSLVQTKRRLAALPGGGPTPLAHGLQAARTLAQSARRKGLTPTLVLMTDGRGNIALDGSADRGRAAADVRALVRGLAMDRMEAVVIDTGTRPEATLRELARMLDGAYLPLPRADARRLSVAVDAALRPA